MNASEWIRLRLAAAPQPLLEAMLAATSPHDGLPTASGLAEAAIDLYRAVAAGEGRRDDALALLAADALFTHAFQVQAEAAPDRFTEFADEWSGHRRLAEVLQ